MRHNSTQAMAYQVDFAARLLQCGIYSLVQLALNKEIWAIRVEPDA
jgi:hypothetical protein